MIKLNLGCGAHPFQGWQNIDLIDHPGVIKHDLSKGLPKDFLPNSVDYIYTEHFIEHITRQEASNLLIHCYLRLRPGGKLRISTPDLETVVGDYMDGKIDRWLPTWAPYNKCQMLNQGLREWGHQYVYDFEDLVDLLNSTGFTISYKVKHKSSSYEQLRGLEVRPYHGDLIMEAVK